ncbi:M20 aminoacylase family protein [Thiofilum flexile]|uniref:M20 aminoacylase family protein n=1 Tax=Thiofilum flexile TaxID=125627 RepID=UPI000364B5CF|nr:M20 aminoacylase family protein [Thiofilum flexile]
MTQPIALNSALHQTMQTWRRDIHQHPETAYEEFRTSEKVAQQLKALGLEVHEHIGGTGIVAILQGSQGTGRHIGLRADMDALPLTELNTFAHKSCHEGKMHGCGHDGHTTMLLGAATYLAEHNDFKGTVYFIFQPAEEGFAGAKRMIEEGLFTRFPIEEVYGMHNWPDLPAGQFAIHAGAVMASTDSFYITITGKGGHAAMPDGVVDPIVVAGQLILAMQTVVSRNLSPLHNGVVSITQIHGGSAINIIPEDVKLCGTIRTLAEQQRTLIKERLAHIVTQTAQTFGAQADLTIKSLYPVTQNTEQEAEYCYEAAKSLVGDSNTLWNPLPSMAAEDFSFMLQQRPGAYIWIGNGGTTHTRPLHNPYYDFNDAILPLGASFWVRLVQERCT